MAWFFNKQTEESVFSSVIDTLFNVAAFIFVGAWMPFREFHLRDGCDGSGPSLEIGRTGYARVVVEEVAYHDGHV
jgi:NhaP-type Na+/H+ or K+/H+ antiporter